MSFFTISIKQIFVPTANQDGDSQESSSQIEAGCETEAETESKSASQ